MSNTVKVTKLVEGQRHVLLHVSVVGDGADGDLIDTVLLNPVDTVGANKATRFYLEQVTASLVGFDAFLSFDSTPKQYLWAFNRNSQTKVNFQDLGSAFKDRSLPMDSNGCLLLSTMGMPNSDAVGTFLIKIRLETD